MSDMASYSLKRAQQSRWFQFSYFSAYVVGNGRRDVSVKRLAATTRRNFCSVIQEHECPSNCRLIICQNFGLTNFAARASVPWFIRLRFPRSLNTHHKPWSGTVAICFASPHFLDLNTDFSARRRTTWWNGKVTSIRVCTSLSTVFTANIANRRQKC